MLNMVVKQETGLLTGPKVIFDIKHSNNTTVARHFLSHIDQLDPNMNINILEYIKLPKDIPSLYSLRDKRQLFWIYRQRV